MMSQRRHGVTECFFVVSLNRPVGSEIIYFTTDMSVYLTLWGGINNSTVNIASMNTQSHIVCLSVSLLSTLLLS